jgi:sortase (surface protein transpeptidase)
LRPLGDMRLPHRRLPATVVAGALVAATLGACAANNRADDSTVSAGTSTAAGGDLSASPRSNATAASPSSALASYRSTRSHDEVAEPTRLRIPAIGVDTPLEFLRRAADQSIEVPRQSSSAGWWADGPRPGQMGPAVVLGHLDSKTGPAVFFRLGELQPGDDVLVDRADGSTVRFVVTALHRYAKTQFPTELVYYPTLQPELRLVTCGGGIDPSTGHYRENLVVFTIQKP